MFGKLIHEGIGHLPVYFRHIILVEGREGRYLSRRQPIRNGSGESHQFDGEDPFPVIIRRTGSLLPGLVGTLQALQHARILGIPGSPLRETRLVGTLLSERTEPFQSQTLALPLFPGIGDVSRLGGILDPHRRIGRHGRIDDIQPLGAHPYPVRVRSHYPCHVIGGHVFPRRTGTAVDEGEVPRIHPTGGNGKIALRTIGDILRRVVGRLVVGIGIDAEYGEVARMARPHPVVGIAAELADRRRGRPHQPHVAVGTEQEEHVLVAVIERLYAHLVALPALVRLHGLLLHPPDVGLDARRPTSFVHPFPHAFQHLGGDILHPYEERHRKTGVRQLLLGRESPETVGQVIVLQTAVALNLVVAAMVVGQQQSPGRHQLSGTAAAEKHHGILQRSLVHAVDVLGRETEPLGLHILHLPADEARQPHALVGPRTERRGQAPYQ